jgi:mannitol-1-/sugar-/sorbitol-6-/2-deoxyglucose-6-phosphatase
MNPALVGDPRLAIADHELSSLAELDDAMLDRWIA